MDTRQLQAFLSAVDVGSFTRAATRLNVTQPTITNRIKALEQSLGSILLERLPGGVRPTSNGLAVIPHAREIVRLTEEVQRTIAAPGETRGRVSVGSPESLTSHRLLPLIEYLYIRYPLIDFSVHLSSPQDAVAQLRSGQLDCVFLIGAQQSHEDLEFNVLRPEPLALVAAPGRTEGDGDRGTPTADSFSTMLVCSDVDAAFCDGIPLLSDVATGTPKRRTLKLNTIDAVKRIAANGIGVALLPEIAVAQEIAQGVLRKLNWQPAVQTFTQTVWRRSRIPRPALDTVLAAAEQVVREE
ncbi:LysR family transcriptional regulator [Streptomyces candidus]|uniref:DNA-binding transcriptional LysR family regulator n=1 Tax=Streptomyces candidus TaxID=67283 RepID=A0A7X0LRX6_9ACTN|nr:LysR family transcriptional regulator [Streptomyces candidus]MBB6438615.1 DNA-binding transcriptional LysR family regulator [Streptomyces candidus]GHH45309.1 LysR family transcriptional regulator [Streptomyces candidus]